MIERVARRLHQSNRYVVEHLGAEGLERQLSIAQTNHCLNPSQVEDEWIGEYHLTEGDFDVTNIDTRFTDKVPLRLRWEKYMLALFSHWTLQITWLLLYRWYMSPQFVM